MYYNITCICVYYNAVEATGRTTDTEKELSHSRQKCYTLEQINNNVSTDEVAAAAAAATVFSNCYYILA